jgi:hypothetical protein
MRTIELIKEDVTVRFVLVAVDVVEFTGPTRSWTMSKRAAAEVLIALKQKGFRRKVLSVDQVLNDLQDQGFVVVSPHVDEEAEHETRGAK